MAFSAVTANVWSGGAARYAGNWYLRARALLVPHQGASAGAALLTVRRYFATAEDYLDVQAGFGNEVVAVGAGGADVRTSRSAALTWRRAVSPALAVQAGGTWNATEGFPARRGLTVGLTHRW